MRAREAHTCACRVSIVREDMDEEYSPEPEKSGAAEGVVTPLVGAVDERADKAGDNDDDRQEEGRHDVRKRQASGDQQTEEDGGEVDEPLDVPNILQNRDVRRLMIGIYHAPTYPDLTSLAAAELCSDGCCTEVRSHGEVRDTCGRQDDNRKLVEETRSTRPLQKVVSISKKPHRGERLPRSLRTQRGARSVP